VKPTYPYRIRKIGRRKKERKKGQKQEGNKARKKAG
jgi:hypothetical protein